MAEVRGGWLSYRKGSAIGSTRVRLTRPRKRVLLALLVASGLDSYSLGRLAQVRSGSLFPALSHLEDAGLLDVMLDETGPGVYARRRFYRLTDEGRRIARSGLGLPQ
jgi:PadR family transcriptional regulator, regulatory protein PadR